MALSFLSNFIYLQSSWTYGHTNVYKFNNCFKFKFPYNCKIFNFEKNVNVKMFLFIISYSILNLLLIL